MKNNLLDSMRNSVKYWWISLIIGILAIILGVWCITTPDSTLIAISYLFIIAFFVSGIFEIIFAISNRNFLAGWGWNLTSGICEVLLGVLLVALPLPVVTRMLIFLVGFWIMFRSFWAIGAACDLQGLGVKGWGWLLALAILSVIFSFIYLLSPIFGSIFIVTFVSIAFIIYGIFRIYLAFQLKSIQRNIKEIEDSFRE